MCGIFLVDSLVGLSAMMRQGRTRKTHFPGPTPVLSGRLAPLLAVSGSDPAIDDGAGPALGQYRGRRSNGCRKTGPWPRRTLPCHRSSRGRALSANPCSCQWTAVDPMAEDYIGMSPFGYCACDPMDLVDINGMNWYSNNGNYIWRDS